MNSLINRPKDFKEAALKDLSNNTKLVLIRTLCKMYSYIVRIPSFILIAAVDGTKTWAWHILSRNSLCILFLEFLKTNST